MVVTADGSVYAQWQVRVCYFHFKKLKKATPHSDAGGFTRLLHRCEALRDFLFCFWPKCGTQPLQLL